MLLVYNQKIFALYYSCDNNLFQVARTVSFPTEVENAYIAMEPISINTKFQATMKFKSEQHDGLIMYVANDTQVRTFILYWWEKVHTKRSIPQKK